MAAARHASRRAQGAGCLRLLVAAALLAFVHSRTVATGDLVLTGTGAAADCSASATADLAARAALQQFSPRWKPQTTAEAKRGPHPRTYPAVAPGQIPATCDASVWAQTRALTAIMSYMQEGYNYCHHHAPAYATPASLLEACEPLEAGADGGSCVCNRAGLSKPKGSSGLDCSNFAAWIFNFCFGFYCTSDIGQLACGPQAPGRVLTDVTTATLDRLRPADLVFVTLGRAGRSPPVRVSHVVLWTGLTADLAPGASGPLSKAALLANLPDKQQAGAARCIAEQQRLGRPVYVIADSTFAGVALRPMCGWYLSSFSHARRIITPPSSAPVNDASIASWDGSDCQSTWALQA